MGTLLLEAWKLERRLYNEATVKAKSGLLGQIELTPEGGARRLENRGFGSVIRYPSEPPRCEVHIGFFVPY
jgi:hypothetical protein